MINPICSRCLYLTDKPEKFRRCPSIPIHHRNMCCSNPDNTINDSVSGDSYRPYCEEVNRHGECLFYYPKELEVVKEIVFDEETNTVCITGKNIIIFTTDGTDPSIETHPRDNFYDESTETYSVKIPLEHTTIVKAACSLEGVISSVRELFIEIPDVPTIEFDKETNTVSIKSYNKVFYTTDGSKVTEDSLVYEKPFAIGHNTTINACSFVREDFSKQVQMYCVSIEAPVINFDSDQNIVSLEADDPILFSIDGSDIYDDSDKYEEPFEIDKNTVIKAACIVDGELSEQVELECKVPNIPVVSYDEKTNVVTITSDNAVRYSVNSDDVKKKDKIYSEPFKISETCIVKAVSVVGEKMSEQAELKCVFVKSPIIDFDENTNTVSIKGDSKILYSTDGSKIYDDAEEYKKPFVIDRNTIVNAACITNGILSNQVSLECKVPSKPLITYNEQVKTVSILSDNPVLYTTDGSDVKKKDSEYKAPFKISTTSLIKAVSIVNNRISEQAELECKA